MGADQVFARPGFRSLDAVQVSRGKRADAGGVSTRRSFHLLKQRRLDIIATAAEGWWPEPSATC